jgi:hypothetical protein
VLVVILVQSVLRKKCAAAAKIRAQKSAIAAKNLTNRKILTIATHRIF